MNGPDPASGHPVATFPQVGFLKNLIKSPNIVVGDYTYYDDPEGPERFEQNVLYHYPFIGDRLVIGGNFITVSRIPQEFGSVPYLAADIFAAAGST